MAPPGWRDSSTPLRLHLRLRFVPESVDGGFRDPNNKHQLYLQLRRDVVEGRRRLTGGAAKQLELAALALQTEFGDFSEDIHGGEGEYFVAEHYLPRPAVSSLGGDAEARRACARLHRAHLGQSQSATELAYCRELQATAGDHGCHCFAVREHKKPISNPSSSGMGRRHLGVHLRGLRLFETSPHSSGEHRCLASFAWRDIARIQYDKCRFQISVQESSSDAAAPSSSNGEATRTAKMKFYVSETKAKIMFDLSSAHHQFYLQQRLNGNSNSGGGNSGGLIESGAASAASVERGGINDGLVPSVPPEGSQNGGDDHQVEYREPREKTIRSLKNRLLSKRQLSQRKLYAARQAAAPFGHLFAASTSDEHSQSRQPRQQQRRRLSSSAAAAVASSSGNRDNDRSSGPERRRSASSRLMVKRLTHYSSMADAAAKKKREEGDEDDGGDLNASNKENRTPNRPPIPQEEEDCGGKQSYR